MGLVSKVQMYHSACEGVRELYGVKFKSPILVYKQLTSTMSVKDLQIATSFSFLRTIFEAQSKRQSSMTSPPQDWETEAPPPYVEQDAEDGWSASSYAEPLPTVESSLVTMVAAFSILPRCTSPNIWSLVGHADDMAETVSRLADTVGKVPPATAPIVARLLCTAIDDHARIINGMSTSRAAEYFGFPRLYEIYEAAEGITAWDASISPMAHVQSGALDALSFLNMAIKSRTGAHEPDERVAIVSVLVIALKEVINAVAAAAAVTTTPSSAEMRSVVVANRYGCYASSLADIAIAISAVAAGSSCEEFEPHVKSLVTAISLVATAVASVNPAATPAAAVALTSSITAALASYLVDMAKKDFFFVSKIDQLVKLRNIYDRNALTAVRAMDALDHDALSTSIVRHAAVEAMKTFGGAICAAPRESLRWAIASSIKDAIIKVVDVVVAVPTASRPAIAAGYGCYASRVAGHVAQKVQHEYPGMGYVTYSMMVEFARKRKTSRWESLDFILS
ncbi:hypothetical protein B0T17DRAFT_597734 [Bombardia bombarda]|uniref:Uncharacterized protein n=1 Tax=Bombardia bombarda TaxID=252184 RepID=A0AA39X8W7_9PEZI|nr:hypothetical protein B0T17DRAFT_597734 [Bombardia bombarda]